MIKLRDYEKERLLTLLKVMEKLKQEFTVGSYKLYHLDSALIKEIIKSACEDENG